MSSRVATRLNGDSNAASRAAYALAAPANGSVTAGAVRHQQQSLAHPGAYNSRRQPLSAAYKVEHVNVNGRETEVLTIMDTPEPGEADDEDAPVAGSSTGASNGRALVDQQAQGTSKRRRKSDPAHISDDPYGTSGVASTSTSAQKRKANDSHYANATTSNNKRKYAQDPYAGYAQADGRAAQKAKQAEEPICDKDGHFIVRPETLLSGEYRIIRQLGQGTFGKVVAAENINTRRQVAIKIIRNIDKYREAAKMEIAVLKKLERSDVHNYFKCIQLIECFTTHGHHCLVSELLGQSVFDFLKENQYAPFPLSHVQSFARQLFSSVSYVHEMNYIHTDLKPENILLEDGTHDISPTRKHRNRKILRNTAIRLIDFGSATGAKDYHPATVSTRHYRAPEIILGLGWSFPCDAWSIGCILVEFVTGEALFQTHENLEHLAMMVKVFGPMPRRFAQKAEKASTFLGHTGWFKPSEYGPLVNFPREDTSKQSRKFVASMKSLENIIAPDGNPASRKFLDLVSSCLKWDPAERITAQEALNHPFLHFEIKDEGSRSTMPVVPGSDR